MALGRPCQRNRGYCVLDRVAPRSNRPIEGINRVVYDISAKPPATIERE